MGIDHYRPSDAKPRFDRAAFIGGMHQMGGHFPHAGIVTYFRRPHTQDLDGVDVAFLEQAELTVAAILAGGARVIAFGGDHMIPLPIVRAYGKHLGRPLSLVHCDGQFDNWDTFPYSWGGSWVAELADEGFLDLERSVQLGIRMVEGDAPEADIYAPRSGAVVISGDECLDEGPPAAAARVREVVADNPVYLTFDADFLDAAVAPACHTPCVCGPDMY